MLKNEQKIVTLTWTLLILLMPLFTLTYYVNLWSPMLGSFCSLMIIAAYLGVPVMVLERFHQDLRSFNLYAHRMETIFDRLILPQRKAELNPDFKSIRAELYSFLLVIALVLIPYAFFFLAYCYFDSLLKAKELYFSLALPPKFIPLVLTQIFVVALPEEFFWRGFVQGALIKKWPNERFLLGIPCGRAVLITNAFFALAHFMLGFAPLRLLTFFPGLIFSALVIREQSLLSAILFHALCNVFAVVMHHSLS